MGDEDRAVDFPAADGLEDHVFRYVVGVLMAGDQTGVQGVVGETGEIQYGGGVPADFSAPSGEGFTILQGLVAGTGIACQG